MRLRTMMKKLPENEDGRKFTYNIFDINEDEKMNGGEMFLFYKYAAFFKQMTRGDVHLLYQRNLEFHVPTQTGNFEIGLFKEELYMFE